MVSPDPAGAFHPLASGQPQRLSHLCPSEGQATPGPAPGGMKCRLSQTLGGWEVAAQGPGCGLFGFFQSRRGGSGLNAVKRFTVSHWSCKRPVSADPPAHAEVPLGISGVSQLPWQSPLLFLSCFPAAGGSRPPAPHPDHGKVQWELPPLFPRSPKLVTTCPSSHPGPFSPALGFPPRHRGPSSVHSTQSCLSLWRLSLPAGRD